MYKRHCILTFMQGARVLGTPHMRFDSMNGTDAHAITGATSQDRALNATSTHTRVQPIKRSSQKASRRYAAVEQRRNRRRMRQSTGWIHGGPAHRTSGRRRNDCIPPPRIRQRRSTIEPNHAARADEQRQSTTPGRQLRTDKATERRRHRRQR